MTEKVIERSLDEPAVIEHWMHQLLSKREIGRVVLGEVSGSLKRVIEQLFFDKEIARVAGGKRPQHCSPLTQGLITRCAWALRQLQRTGRQTSKNRHPEPKITEIPVEVEPVHAESLTMEKEQLSERFAEQVGAQEKDWAGVFTYFQGKAFHKALEQVGGQAPQAVSPEVIGQVVADAFISAVARLLPSDHASRVEAQQVIAHHLYICFYSKYGREWKKLKGMSRDTSTARTDETLDSTSEPVT